MTQIFFKLIFLASISLFLHLNPYFYQSVNKSRAKNRDEKRDSQREQLRWQLRFVIRVLAYQNATARTPYLAMIARANNLSRAIIALRLQIYRSPSNRAICYSGRAYGNVYHQTGRSWIVNNNLRQYNHTRDIINVMNTYRGPRANFAISA